ncbi:sprT domain-containing protein [Spirosoma sp. BT704]|uniref:SprT domain-containing protein n=1 Tax=Spirosoma validum TaxID=2771355 RepID=A0A927B6T6_9BACT|nr:sprT domain-containing protein [Spirosoma validum]
MLSNYVPEASVVYCQQLWQQYQFTFQVARPRRTRLGDFRVLPYNRTQITVNANLNPYAFLITYVHEVAHAAVHSQNKSLRRSHIRPHGPVWQTAFQQLMQPILNEDVFPKAILQPLRQYLLKPAATTYANPALVMALRQVDQPQTTNLSANQVMLRDVSEGRVFQFAKKTFIRGTLRRTRVVCKEVSSGRSYAILAHALVEIIIE